MTRRSVPDNHHCPICHDLTDCPDLCARCARLRSRPEDWTDHPQDTTCPALHPTWTDKRCVRQNGHPGSHKTTGETRWVEGHV